MNKIILMAMIGVCVTGCRYDEAKMVPQEQDNPLYNLDVDFDKRLGYYIKEVRDLLRDEDLCGSVAAGGTLTTKEYSSKYTVVYVDEKNAFFSYRIESFLYTGGAHGNTFVCVGTIDVASGKELKIADVIPLDKRDAALAKINPAVIEKIGGAENLLGEVTLTENFYVAADGLHFIFNEYEVACYAQGVVEVVLPTVF